MGKTMEKSNLQMDEFRHVWLPEGTSKNWKCELNSTWMYLVPGTWWPIILIASKFNHYNTKPPSLANFSICFMLTHYSNYPRNPWILSANPSVHCQKLCDELCDDPLHHQHGFGPRQFDKGCRGYKPNWKMVCQNVFLKYMYKVLQSDPFEVVKWPFLGLSDLDGWKGHFEEPGNCMYSLYIYNYIYINKYYYTQYVMDWTSIWIASTLSCLVFVTLSFLSVCWLIG